MKKRGISDIITTVLIVLLALSAIIIIWNVVLKFVEDKSGEIDVEILTVNLKISNVYLNYTANNLSLQVSRGSDSVNISSVKIVLTNNLINLQFNEMPPQSNGNKVYVLNILSIRNITKILAYPVSKKGKLGIPAVYEIKESDLRTPATGWPSGPVSNPSLGGVGTVGQECTSDISCDDENECTDNDAQQCVGGYLQGCEGENLDDETLCEGGTCQNGVCVLAGCQYHNPDCTAGQEECVNNVCASTNPFSINANYDGDVSWNGDLTEISYINNDAENYLKSTFIYYNEPSLYNVSHAYIEFDISSIPDNTQISSVELNILVNENSEDSCSIKSMPNQQPSLSQMNDIWNAIQSGTAYVDNNDFCASSGEKTIDLGNKAVTDLQNALLRNWFAVGITENNEGNDVNRYANFPSVESGTPAKLVVYYS